MLEDQFDFVLLAEFFDESLVILAKRFCWDLEQANYSDFLWEKTRSGRGYWFSPWKEPGIAQVRYLKQNSRRKDAVSKMTLETRETLEVNINFGTLQCFFLSRNGLLLTTNSTTTFFKFLREKSWGGKRHEQVSCSYGKEALARDVDRLRRMNKQLEKECVLAIPTIPGWVAIWGEDKVWRCSQPWWSGWVRI